MVAQNVFHRRLPIRQQICDVSQIGVTFHGICPPIFIQTWLQQYSRGAFLYSAHCSLSNPICFWSVWCRRTMIPGKIFASFAKFHWIVSVNDFRLPIWLQKTFASFFEFPVRFLFCTDSLGSIEWLSPAPQLHIGDCFEIRIVTEDLVICCYQVTKIVSTRYSSTIASSAPGPCNFSPLADLAISVFSEMSINTVFTQILTSLEYGL